MSLIYASDFIDGILSRVTLPGAISLGLIAVIPSLIVNQFNVSYNFASFRNAILESMASDRELTIEDATGGISDDQVAAIHAASLDVLASQGMRVLHPPARALYARAGADVQGDTVRLDAALVAERIDEFCERGLERNEPLPIPLA